MKPANRAAVYAAALYPDLAEIARAHGYALAVHGSLARDFDLIAIPWREKEKVSPPKTVVKAMKSHFAIREIGESDVTHHGRIRFTLSVGFSDSFVDLSFMPVI